MPLYPASQVAFSEKLRARADQLANEAKAKKAPKPRPTPPVEEPIVVDPKIAEIPYRYKQLEPTPPVEVANDDPVFDAVDAATILGIKSSRLLKWKERDQGPAYVSYEPGDFARYELSELLAFRAAHRIRPSRQPHPGKRR